MYDTAVAANAATRGQIQIIEDLSTGLCYNRTFEPNLMVYDHNYQNEQGNSSAFRSHLNWVRDLILDHIGTDSLVEVGCGKGGFLRMLADAGAKITGYDPTFEGDDKRIEKCYFHADLGVSANGIILRHVLEHISDPVSFLRQISAANSNRGLIYIEVPCFDWICENNSWFDIFYEHVNYFRLKDFKQIFGHVIESGQCFGGQYIYVIADLSDIRDPVYDPESAVNFPPNFMADALGDVQGSQDVVWGGASKGLIYALLRDRAGQPVFGVVDINPAKQAKYLAAVGIQVSAPEDLLPQLGHKARIIIMNMNYKDEIVEMTENKFNYVEVGQ